ncbi:LOB domain-containing protein 6-like isoform X2 [Phalaenopsis equestris]|uniref:LOB domain-containing protein 6-like isoform X2 n=1 Tax=Phalaenopsis equestris TaxID=78828 RepID=UPI0009E5B029|nr:LOB domain-containing protein 6-like isoform X2 [Phalaenopsis equestris]XP_020597149.1 LOB domain-containing protein 6-like isoform X2 [Phalaenopsis equestris]
MIQSSGERAAMSREPRPPCAGCKFLRRKCQPNCIFAPHFPSNQPHKFADVHRVFGASNIAKLLNDLPPNLRDDAVLSLVYEAQMRLHDPVFGCVGIILVLEDQLQRLKSDLSRAWGELMGLEMAAGMQEQQRMMMMMMMMAASGSGAVDDSGLVTGGSFGGQLGVAEAAGGDDEGYCGGVGDYLP